MLLILIFSFLAGIVTILSPCILPMLPIILSSTFGPDGKIDKLRPLGVVLGFVLSFTFFTLFLSTIVQSTGISASNLRLLSVFIIFAFGLAYLVPQFLVLLERMFTSFSKLAPSGNQKTGIGGGLLIGFSLGLLWTPCVGPILAAVISLAISGAVTFNSFLVVFAYSLGTAIPMFMIMLGGQKLLGKLPWVTSNTEKIQKVFGVVMILMALAIYFNLDKSFQNYILNTLPNYAENITFFEQSPMVDVDLIQ